MKLCEKVKYPHHTKYLALCALWLHNFHSFTLFICNQQSKYSLRFGIQFSRCVDSWTSWLSHSAHSACVRGKNFHIHEVIIRVVYFLVFFELSAMFASLQKILPFSKFSNTMFVLVMNEFFLCFLFFLFYWHTGGYVMMMIVCDFLQKFTSLQWISSQRFFPLFLLIKIPTTFHYNGSWW